MAGLKRVRKLDAEKSSPPQEKPQPAAPPPVPQPQGSLIMPLEEEPPGTPIQRGFISDGRAERIKLQLWLADNLRKSIAPNIPLDLPL